MRQESFFENNQGLYFGDRVKDRTPGQSGLSNQLDKLGSLNLALPRQTAIGLILIIALLAFELFNFDTTQFALRDLLGDVSFVGLRWATILAIAFCAIDFAGLAHMFTPSRGSQASKEVWYLMGAWLLGATMNALMTWWAISLTLLNHEFGNEVLSREQLLQVAPIFVAVLVWLTRILFIGAFSVAGIICLTRPLIIRPKPFSPPSGRSPPPGPLYLPGQSRPIARWQRQFPTR